MIASSGHSSCALAVVRLADGRLTRVTRSGGYDGAPSWSPDGMSIAFESSPDPGGESPTGIYRIPAP